MTENEDSRASPDFTPASRPASATPGSVFRPGRFPADTTLYPPEQPHQYTLHFLIAAIKKPGPHHASTNPQKAR